MNKFIIVILNLMQAGMNRNKIWEAL